MVATEQRKLVPSLRGAMGWLVCLALSLTVALAHAERRVLTTGESLVLTQRIALSNPALWSTETPHLYSFTQTLRSSQQALAERRTSFGIRSISFDATHGFLLNGRRVLLRGGNIHHDNYMLGAAGFPRADERKVELMKAAGYNAIRNAHNPASRATLDAAEESIVASGADIAYVTAGLLDASGRSIYATQNDLPLSFQVTGAGELAVGNGNPYGTESRTTLRDSICHLAKCLQG